MVSKNYNIDKCSPARPMRIPPPPPPLAKVLIPTPSTTQYCCNTFTSARSTLHSERFKYLSEKPVEITSALKGYGNRGSSSDVVYQAERGTSEWNSDRKRVWKNLRWILLVASVLLLVGVIIYFLLIDLQVESPVMTTVRESEDLVALDGRVILDIGGVTYQQDLYRVTQGQAVDGTHSSTGGDSHGSKELFNKDFIEIVEAPDLRTSPAVTEHDLIFYQGTTKSLSDSDNSTQPKTSDLDRNESQGIQIRNNPNQIVSIPIPSIPNEEEEIMMTSDLNIGQKYQGHRYQQKTNAHSREPIHPTLPSLILKETKVILGDPFAPQNETESRCFSPRLDICKGVLPYDLTTLPLVPGISRLADLDAVLPYFEMILQSGCSKRSRQFVCSLLEPACQPMGNTILPPCRKACKAVAEDCSDFMLETLDLSKVFHCNLYPDVDDPAQCVNFAKGEECLPDEFRCSDGNCIPWRWVCDSVSDCSSASDESNCTTSTSQCTDQQFKCDVDNKCLPLKWRCDGNTDCTDGSDELHCFDYASSGHPHTSPCPVGELRCLDGRCITMQQLCDGVHDCSDGADEANC